MSVLSDKGFLRPTFAQLLEGLESRAGGLFGPGADLSEHAALGKFLRILAYELAGLYEELEGVYFARFPNYAAGVQLDRLAPFAGVRRQPAAAAEYWVRLSGTAGTRVPMGFRVATADGLVFYTAEQAALDEEGALETRVLCTQPGEIGNVDPSSIRVVVDAGAFVWAAQGLSRLAAGQNAETDAALRGRFAAAVAGAGSATALAIRAAVLRLSGVTGCTVAENDTDEPTPEGRPPHSFEVYVLGPAPDQDIAGAIFSKKPLGIHSHGQLAAQVTDSAGAAHTVRFSRVAVKQLQLKAEIKVNNLFPKNGEQQVRAALAGALDGFAAGQDVVYAALFPLLYQVAGVVDVAGLSLSADGGQSFGAANIPMGPFEAARLAAEDIQLEVAEYEQE